MFGGYLTVCNINLVVTQDCNLNCKYCFREKTKRNTFHFASAVDLLDAISRVDTIDACTITGGEPLLYRNMESLLDYISTISSTICLLTNGTLVDSRYISLFEKYQVQLHVTLDSISTNYHEENRGKQQLIINNIKKLSGNPKVHGSLYMVLSHQNYGELRRIQQFALEVGWEFDYGILACEATNSLSWHNACPEDREQALSMIEKYTLNNKRDELKLKLFELLCNGVEITNISCLFAKNNIVLLPDGSVRTCYNNPEYYMGNYYEDTPEVIISNLRAFRAISRKCNQFSANCFGVFL